MTLDLELMQHFHSFPRDWQRMVFTDLSGVSVIPFQMEQRLFRSNPDRTEPCRDNGVKEARLAALYGRQPLFPAGAPESSD